MIFIRFEKKETDFQSLHLYYNYLETIENLIESLRDNINPDKARQEITDYKA